MAIKLHRCRLLWLKIDVHPCWRVQRALDETGVTYQLVPGPVRRGRRDELERLSRQRSYPVIEFDDGTVYRQESKAMVGHIRSGNLPAGTP